ncbi:MAG: hypothetical protein KJZ95_02085 [Caldilinea sp.]|nr:hypothetical protein [Caldilinea sp.]
MLKIYADMPWGRARRLLCMLLASVLSIAFADIGSVHAQSPFDGFAPGFNNEVRAFALQSDGRLLVGGAFTQINLTPRNRLVRLDPGGALDITFSASVNQTVHALAVDANDRVLVGGAFTQVNSATRNRIARLAPDGALDLAFNPNINGTVHALMTLENGDILVGGDFTNVGGAASAYLVRLNSDGAPDLDFIPEINGPVYALAIQRNGAIVIGGDFTQVDGQPRHRLARFTADGALDPTFAPNVDAAVRALAIGIDDAILAGGDFESIDGAARGRLARFTADGALAATPTLSFNDSIRALLVLADGRVVVGGAFTSINGQPATRLARLVLDHTLDATFAPAPNDTVYALVSQSDDKVVAGGAFTIAGDEVRNRAARFYIDGSLDADFAPAANEEASQQVTAIAIQPDGKIVVGGSFTQYVEQPRLRLARFLPDGRLDATFNPGANNEVQALAIQPDGKIIVAGNFTQIAGQNRSFLARLFPNGELDPAFEPFPASGVNGVRAIALQTDGKIVVAIEPALQTNKQPRLLRLNGDGTVDASFQTAINEGQVVALAIQADGRIIACGEFAFESALGPSGNLARLTQTGSIDMNYAPDVTRCLTVRLQPDGRLLFGGLNPQLLARFNPNGNVDNSFNPDLVGLYISSIALQSDGRAIVAVNFEDEQRNKRGRVLRIGPNGGADPTFTAHDANGPLLAIALQKDGKPVLGGGFTEIGEQGGATTQRVWLARLSATTAAQQSLRVESDGTTFLWKTGGAFPSPIQTDFAYSTDGVTFTPIGAGLWTPNGWLASGGGAPFNQEYFLRVGGVYASGVWNASLSKLESTARMFVPGGALEVVTAVEPEGLTPQWRIDVTGNTLFSDTLIGADTTGAHGVGLGVYTVTLNAAAGTVMEEFRIAHRCTINGQTGAIGEGNVVELAVKVNDSIQCTFTATRRTGQLEVRHVIEPTAPNNVWTLLVLGPTAYTTTLTGDATTGAQIVFTGVYTLDLSQNGSVDYTTSYRCNVGEQTLVSGEGVQATLNVANEQQVTCLFHSVRNQSIQQLFLPMITR